MWLLACFSCIAFILFLLLNLSLHYKFFCANVLSQCSYTDFADEKLVLQHKDWHALALVQSRLDEEGLRIFFAFEAGLFVPALPTEENWLSAATVPRKVRSNQGSARRGGAEWRALYFVLCLPGFLSAWRKFMLSLCHRKSARLVGDHYLQGACRQRRLSPRALGTMRYPCARPGVPAISFLPGTAPPAASARTPVS